MIADLANAPAAPAGGEGYDLDVLVVGAGLSGIGAGYHLKARCPQLRYAIVEARENIGGTWDFFKYPGLRSDSDMHTLGYNFSPWVGEKAIADGPSILAYVKETAREHGIDRKIRFGHRVVAAAWSTETATWTVDVERKDSGERVRFTARFLMMCSGYYSYAEGYTPDFPGASSFGGTIVHPQFWPGDLDVTGKRIVVIGSGATAVTLVPELAKTAAHVTMLQRSPSYFFSRPAKDAIAGWLRKRLPTNAAHTINRWLNVGLTMLFYGISRQRPDRMKKRLVGLVSNELGADYDVATHFTPSYKPWDQRLCVVPDSDLFKAIRGGNVAVATDHIESFEPHGIKLRSGVELPADIIVTATGLKLNLLGDVKFAIDGAPVDFAKVFAYKGVLFSGVPNLASVFGYVNASWTLKADLASEYVCRLLNYMDSKGFVSAIAPRDASMDEQPFLDFSSGYVKRAIDMLPKQGTKKPWVFNQNYVKDIVALRFGPVNDGVMKFAKGAKRSAKR